MIFFLIACTNDNDKTTDPETQAILDVKAYTSGELDAFADAAAAIQAATPEDWSDTAAIEAAWKDARVAYEHAEGAIAVLFPDLDASTDERYDGFLAEGPDDYLFDDEGVIGVHAIERIVWSDRVPAEVVTFEEGLPDYTPAAFPANATEQSDFRDLLCQRLVDDTITMRDEFEPLALDSATAFRGAIGSMAEQYEKVALASLGQDESRYAQHTLGDMRANLDGGRAIVAAFGPWIDDDTLLGEIVDAFERIEAGYSAINGDAIPAVPATWNPDAPSEADLATPYGQLYMLVATEADPTISGSLVERLQVAADQLGIPQLP